MTPRLSRCWFLLLPILGGLIATGCDAPEPPDPFVGKPAPDATLVPAQSDERTKGGLTISSLKGHVVLLEFWATWCGPCQSVMPDVESLYNKYKDQGLKVVAVSSEAMATIQGFRQKMPYTYPAYQDATGVASTAFEADAIPATFVIDRSGVVTFHVVGADPQSVAKAVDDAMSGKMSAPPVAGS